MARAVTDPRLIAQLEGGQGVIDTVPKESTLDMVKDWAKWFVDPRTNAYPAPKSGDFIHNMPMSLGGASQAAAEPIPGATSKTVTQQPFSSSNNSSTSRTRGQVVTDPNLIAQLEGGQPPSALQTGLSRAGQFAGRPFPTFPEMLSRIPDYASKGAGVAGTALTEALGKYPGNNPGLTAGNWIGALPPHQQNAAYGLGVAMAPDALMALLNPEQEAKSVEKSAVPFARRALGYSKRFMQTPFARGRAAQAAETALAEDIIPKLGSPEVMAERATALKNKAGSAIGSIRDSVGKVGVNPILSRLDELKQKLVGSNVGGDWEEIAKKIDKAKESVSGIGGAPEPIMGAQPIERNTGILGPKGSPVMKTEMQPVQVGQFKKPVGLSEVGKLKARKADQINWLSDLSTQKEGKAIIGALEKGMEDIMTKAGADMKQYRAAKSLYGNTSNMLKALSNELPKQGNMPVSLPAVMVGAGELATGNIPGALAAAGLSEFLKRRGAGIAARGINDISRATPNIGLKSSILSNILKRRRQADADSNPQ